jgi:hypothetical protein
MRERSRAAPEELNPNSLPLRGIASRCASITADHRADQLSSRVLAPEHPRFYEQPR